MRKRRLQIPYGWHPDRQIFLDAYMAEQGKRCGCVCHACKKPLWCAKGDSIGPYFRHASLSDCDGGLESLMHELAKIILLRHNALSLPDGQVFSYTECTVEHRTRYDVRPDIYLVEESTINTLVVEILYSHKTALSTLRKYWEHGERVVQIDISSTKDSKPALAELTQLVLRTAPRVMLVPVEELAPVVLETAETPEYDLRIMSEAKETGEKVGDFLKEWGRVIAVVVVVLLCFIFRTRRRPSR